MWLTVTDDLINITHIDSFKNTFERPLLSLQVAFEIWSSQKSSLICREWMCPQMLVQYGAAVNRTDRNGCTPLYKAAYHGRPVLVDMLVKAGMSAFSAVVYIS